VPLVRTLQQFGAALFRKKALQLHIFSPDLQTPRAEGRSGQLQPAVAAQMEPVQNCPAAEPAQSAGAQPSFSSANQSCRHRHEAIPQRQHALSQPASPGPEDGNRESDSSNGPE
jgi:hypothetical protein